MGAHGPGLTAGEPEGTELDSLNVDGSCVTWSFCGAPGSGTRIYSWCINFIIGAHFLWCNTMLSLDKVGRGRLNLLC